MGAEGCREASAIICAVLGTFAHITQPLHGQCQHVCADHEAVGHQSEHVSAYYLNLQVQAQHHCAYYLIPQVQPQHDCADHEGHGHQRPAQL